MSRWATLTAVRAWSIPAAAAWQVHRDLITDKLGSHGAVQPVHPEFHVGRGQSFGGRGQAPAVVTHHTEQLIEITHGATHAVQLMWWCGVAPAGPRQLP